MDEQQHQQTAYSVSVYAGKNDFFLQRTDDLQASLSNVKKCLDKILEMRARCSELVMDLTCLNSPELMMKILKCEEVCTKCEELIPNVAVGTSQMASENE